MDFKVNNGELAVSFTDDEISKLSSASGDPTAFEAVVDDVVEANRPSDECCSRPALYNRLPCEAMRAVQRSEQIGPTALNATEVYSLGVKVGFAMFGSQNRPEVSRRAIPVDF